MAPFVAWCGRQIKLSQLLTVLGVALVTATTGPQTATAEPATLTAPHRTSVRIQLDQAKIIKLPEKTATLVVGNPLIADVSVQNGNTLVITGKSYGITNLVALDRNGQALMDSAIEVGAPGGQVVYLFRGIERESYSCTPECERRITLGDTTPYFTTNLTQTGTLNTQAQSIQQQK